MRILVAAFVLSCTCEVALAADDASVSTAPGVAEMLQRRQESQLREQLVKEGRLDEVRRMDEEHLRRQQIQKKRAIIRLNTELAREGKVESTVNGDGGGGVSVCVTAPVAAKAKTNTSGTNTSYVR